jgi:hypothetical protein
MLSHSKNTVEDMHPCAGNLWNGQRPFCGRKEKKENSVATSINRMVSIADVVTRIIPL